MRQIRRGNAIAGRTRFFGLGTVPLQHPEVAAMELTRITSTIPEIVGIQIGTHCPRFDDPVSDFNFIERDDLDHPKFEPLWKCANELQAPIFMHPW